MARKLELRIAVGTSPRHLASSIWRIWQGKHTDDIYIAPRGLAGSLKCSLHASRYSYIGFTRQEADRMTAKGQQVPPRRAITFWQRPQTSENEYRNVVGITIPHSAVREFEIPIDKPTWLIEPPPENHATVIGITFSRFPVGKLEMPPGYREISYTQLSTGEFAFVFCARAPFDKSEFQGSDTWKRIAAFDTTKIAAPESEYIGKPMRLLVMNDAEKEQKLKILDLAVIPTKKAHSL